MNVVLGQQGKGIMGVAGHQNLMPVSPQNPAKCAQDVHFIAKQ